MRRLVIWLIPFASIVGLIAAIFMFGGSGIESQMAALKADLPVGISRDDAYARVRAHKQTAFNRDLLTNDGDWPRPSEPLAPDIDGWSARGKTDRTHPTASVEYRQNTLRCFFFCEEMGFLEIYFDKNDRVSKVTTDLFQATP